MTDTERPGTDGPANAGAPEGAVGGDSPLIDPSARAILALSLGGIVEAGELQPRLHWRVQDEGYAEERVCRGALIALTEGARLRFKLTSDAKIDFVRLVAPAVMGRYRFEFVAFGRDVADLGCRVMQTNGRRCTDHAGAMVEFEFGRIPGYVEFDLRDLMPVVHDASAVNEIDVRIARVDATSSLREIFTTRLDELSADINAASQERTSDTLVLLGQLRDAATDAALRDARIQSESEAMRASWDDYLARLQHRDDAEREAMGELATRISGLEAELGLLRHRMENVFWRRWLRRLRGASS